MSSNIDASSVTEPGSFSPVQIAKSLIKAIRLKQSPKNLFVFAAILFSGELFRLHEFLRVSLAFLLFTVVSGSVYLLNDLLDVEQDRFHPQKRSRPIASGALPIPVAVIAMFLLGGFGIFAGYKLEFKFGLALAAYMALQIAYCVKLKNIVLLDVFVLAGGFLIRTAAGGVVIHVAVSQWLLLCSLEIALFLGLGKRRQELVTLGESAWKHRPILDEYSLPLLDQLIILVVGMTIVSYSIYTVESPSARSHPHLWVTVPIVLYGIFRYLYLVYRKGWGGAPDEVLMKDRALQVDILLWLIVNIILFAWDKPHLPGL